MEVDVLELKKLINLAESAVREKKGSLHELEYLLRQKETEAVTLEGLISGLERKKLNKKEKQYLKDEIGKLEVVRKDIKNLKKLISSRKEKVRNNEQLLKKWNEKAESTWKTLIKTSH